MKPQKRPFAVEIKRRRDPVNGKSGLNKPLSHRDTLDRVGRPAPRSRREETSWEAALDPTLVEAERVFGGLSGVGPTAPVASAAVDTRPPTRRPGPAPFHATSTASSSDAEAKVGPTVRSGRVLPDLLSATQEKERVHEAQVPEGGRRRRGTREAPACSEAIEPKATGREKLAGGGQRLKALRVGVNGSARTVGALHEKDVGQTATPAIEQTEPSQPAAASSAKPLRQKAERAGRAVLLKPGERWKRRLPLVCR